MVVEDGADVSGPLAVVAWLASINALVLIFNLIPAFPLDGGRIARAIAWRLTGDRNRATRFAATLGQGFAYLFIAIGVLLLVQGAVLDGHLARADRVPARARPPAAPRCGPRSPAGSTASASRT